MFLMAVSFTVPSYAQTDLPRITHAQAQELANATLNSYWSCPHEDCSVNYLPRQIYPDFYAFEVQSSNYVASPHLGALVVNSYTGDMWDVAGFCKRISSQRIRMLQRHIKNGLAVTNGDYKRLREKKPECDAE